MQRAGNWMRRQLATYGAAIAIILEQLDAYPRSTITEDPNPLVRIRERGNDCSGWHPDELITRTSGEQYVLIWESLGQAEHSSYSRISSN